ncbi:MAG: DNA polymerase III subunit epsilon [Alphaproteobacteria bacterium]
MREVVLDTETTGLDPGSGHRVVEIGCIELINHLPIGRTYQQYVNPERDVPEDALRVHGLSGEFLRRHPTFDKIVDRFLAFLEDSRLVIHNASFDLGFLNAELARVGRPALVPGRAIDTVVLARRKYPGARASLDALCQRFEIDLSDRSLHGALLDARLLAEVYLELIGGRQPDLGLAAARAIADAPPGERPVRSPRPHAPSEAENAAHTRLLDGLNDPIWRG